VDRQIGKGELLNIIGVWGCRERPLSRSCLGGLRGDHEERSPPGGEVVVHLEEGGLGRTGQANFLGDRADPFLCELLERLAVAPHVGDADALAGLIIQWKRQPAVPFPPLVKPIFWMTWSYWSAVGPPLKSNCSPIAILSSFQTVRDVVQRSLTLRHKPASEPHIYDDFGPVRGPDRPSR